MLKAKTPIALLINVKSKLTEDDKCEDKSEKDQKISRYCNMTETKFMQKIGLKPSDKTTPFTDYFLPDYYHCGKSVCYQKTDKFADRCNDDSVASCPYPKCCGCQKDCLDKSFCEAFEIKIQTKLGLHEPTVTKVGFQIARLFIIEFKSAFCTLGTTGVLLVTAFSKPSRQNQ